MRRIILIAMLYCFHHGFSQSETEYNPLVNVRCSFLLFPFSPLLTLEVRTIGNLTLQFESNFTNTHGVNLKYFIHNEMDGHYLFTGLALVENELLRENGQITYLPYAGYGFAHRFGKKKRWTFDNRIGIGHTTNADRNGIYPVIKTGVGRLF